MAYSQKVMDHYENPRNVGSFDKNDKSVATGMVGAPACGDVMKLQIKVSDDGVIEDAKFKTYVAAPPSPRRRSSPNGCAAKPWTKRSKSKTTPSSRNWHCRRSKSTAPFSPRTPSRPRSPTTAKSAQVKRSTQ